MRWANESLTGLRAVSVQTFLTVPTTDFDPLPRRMGGVVGGLTHR